MSYIQDTVIKDFSIFSLSGDQVSLGGEISTLLTLDYGESIFEPTIKMVATFAATEKIASLLPLRGTETVTVKVVHPSGTLEFNNLVVQGMTEENSSSTATVFSVNLTTPDAIANEQNRLTLRYDPTTKISTHVERILNIDLRTNMEFEIEETANSEGFYGNYWRPFKAIYWLAKRSMSKTGSSDGSGTDRVGYLFWETKSGYKFKSIDTIASESKDNVVQEFSQSEVVDENDRYIRTFDSPFASSDFHIFNPYFERDQDIIDQMRKGLYSDSVSFINIHSLTPDLGQDLNYSEVFKRQTHFGGEKDLVDLAFGVNENGGLQNIAPFVDGTMNTDGKIDYSKVGNGESNPHKVVSQSRMKYASMRSMSLRITVPFNLELEAGLPIMVNLLSPNRGLDKQRSGVYLIKDLRHSYNAEGSYTHLRLIRDSYGIDNNVTTNVLQ